MSSTNIFLLWPLTQLILYCAYAPYPNRFRMLGSGMIHAALGPYPEYLLNRNNLSSLVLLLIIHVQNLIVLNQ